MLPFLPSQYRFAGLGFSFPEGPAYRPALQKMWQATPGRVFAIIPAANDRKALRAERINRTLQRWGLDEDCQRLAWLAKRLKLEAEATVGSHCRLVVPASLRTDVPAEDRRIQSAVADRIDAYEIKLLGGSCLRKRASIGSDEFPYQWCRLVVR